MPLIEYKPYKPHKTAQRWIDLSNQIIQEYKDDGYELTLRQLYYQLVARGYVDNLDKNYKRLGEYIARGRDGGLVDWDAIIDRTRYLSGVRTYDSVSDAIEHTADTYRIDKWVGQGYRCDVWVEKEALAGVVERACFDDGVQVNYVSCRGYMSASTVWKQAQRIRRLSSIGVTPVIIHLGDHDPSGLDMSRDNKERLSLYSGLTEGEDFIFTRIALNMDQVRRYSPPPNPNKETDSRSPQYTREHGPSSWELDALDPSVLVTLIRDEIDKYRDHDTWEALRSQQESDRRSLRRLKDDWERDPGDTDE